MSSYPFVTLLILFCQCMYKKTNKAHPFCAMNKACVLSDYKWRNGFVDVSRMKIITSLLTRASFSNEGDLTVHGSTQIILWCFRLELSRTGLDRKNCHDLHITIFLNGIKKFAFVKQSRTTLKCIVKFNKLKQKKLRKTPKETIS